MPDAKILILDHDTAMKKITRMAWQIYENNLDTKELIVAGIDGRGYKVAEYLAGKLHEISPHKITLHKLLLNKEAPKADGISIEPDIKVKDKTTIIVDDVLNSGRTLIYSFIPFLNHGVRNIQTAVLVDRNHKIFPVGADYVGMSLATTSHEHVQVEINARGEISAYLQ